MILNMNNFVFLNMNQKNGIIEEELIISGKLQNFFWSNLYMQFLSIYYQPE